MDLSAHQREWLDSANERIRQLEQLNATLAAEIDRMRPVVEAAVGVANDTLPGLATGRWVNLRNQVRRYHELSKSK